MCVLCCGCFLGNRSDICFLCVGCAVVWRLEVVLFVECSVFFYSHGSCVSGVAVDCNLSGWFGCLGVLLGVVFCVFVFFCFMFVVLVVCFVGSLMLCIVAIVLLCL